MYCMYQVHTVGYGMYCMYQVHTVGYGMYTVHIIRIYNTNTEFIRLLSPA